MIAVVEKAPQAVTWKLLHDLADKAAPELRAIFLQAVAETVNGVVLPQVSAALARGDLAAAEALIPWESIAVSTLEAALPETLRSVVNGAAGIAANGLSSVIPPSTAGVSTAGVAEVPAARLTMRFDLVNRHAVDWANAHAAELITDITANTRDAIRSVIVRGQRDGLAPEPASREIRRLIGLTERDATAVQNLRARLEADGRKPAQIDRMTESYADRLLNARALNIARTETMTAANTGNRLLNEEAMALGYLDADTARQFWLVTADDRLCAYCRQIRIDNQGGVPIGRPFKTPDGPLDAPPAHSSCRCAVQVKP